MKEVGLVGEKFGRWTVMSKAKNKGKNTAWNCLCECGIERSVLTYNLTSGKSSSCGCGQKEAASKVNTTHGKRNTKLYGVYSGMKQRCYNENSPAYKYYGGKGVYICKEWLDDFMNFYNWAKDNGYGKGMSIDRIDPNGNYEPDNCRWADRVTQNTNQRKSSANTSGFVGVYWNISKNKWTAKVGSNNKLINIGSFKTKEDAVQARDNYIIENGLPHKLSGG